MLAVSPSFLDGKNHPEHVRIGSWYEYITSFPLKSNPTYLYLVNLATYFVLDARSTPFSSRRVSSAIALLTFTAVVFRAEVALLLGPLALQLLLTNKISFVSLIKVGLISGLFSLGLSFLISVGLTLISKQ